ncbi:MAG TPA: prepilin-type N-terminal cleavage/methylation domain-containing protein, partial [Elusimicrobiota bacterium]|nr:prepilin-type N-terminal cleavage/methylation domain-containing protein [Elusimicrobiota bacterium]
MTQRSSPKKGFTLIEMMLVVAIIGLLAAIAMPQFANLVIRSKEGAMKGHLGSMRAALNLYYVNNDGNYPYYMTLVQYPNALTDGGYIDRFPYAYNPRLGFLHGGEFVRSTYGVNDAGASGPPPGSNKGYCLNSFGGDYEIHLNCTPTDTLG